MEITKEQIENLNQLDRIEYKFEFQKLKDNWDFIPYLEVIKIFAILIGSTILLHFYLITYGIELLKITTFESLLTAFIISFIIGIILTPISWTLEKREINKLNKKYFEINNRRNKNARSKNN